MKKLIVLVLLGILYTSGAIAQEFELQTKVDTIPGNQILYNLNITVLNGSGNFSYVLMDNDPWNNGQVLDKVKNTSNKYTFKNITPGKYYLCVKNSTELSKCIWIKLD